MLAETLVKAVFNWNDMAMKINFKLIENWENFSKSVLEYMRDVSFNSQITWNVGLGNLKLLTQVLLKPN